MELKKRIFVVEDDQTIRDYIVMVLKKFKYHVSSSENGAKAVEKIAQENPDLVLLDVMLPDMDGISVCKNLRANPKTDHIPVIMLTCLTDSATIRDAHLYGAVDFIAKPFDQKTLKARIDKALSKIPQE